MYKYQQEIAETVSLLKEKADMETIGFTIFCLAVAGVVYWSLLYDDRLGEDDDTLFPKVPQADEQGSVDK